MPTERPAAGKPLRVLHVEDVAADADLAAAELARAGYDVVRAVAATREALVQALAADRYDVVLADYRMPGWTGMDALALVREASADLPLIVVTGSLGEEEAVECVKNGAADYVLKSHLGRLPHVIERALHERRLEEQLRHAQKLEAVGRLAGGIAHDFNNLLTAIIGCADLLIESLPPGADGRADAADIRKAAQRAAELTRQLLAFSRHQVLRPRVVCLNAIVADVDKLLRRLISEDIMLSVHLAPDLVPVLADPGQIEQVIVNLAVNARDSMPQGGALTIATGNIEVRADSPERVIAPVGRYAALTITDTGSGMDDDVQAHMFEPFFTTKPVGMGTGLGLATVYGIIKQSGGSIAVRSARGRGTVITVLLPRVAGTAEAHPTGAAPADVRGSETVLVVEDDAQVRQATMRQLGTLGYSVLAAADGSQALRLVRGYPGGIDLLLTDVVMPGLSGAATAQRLAALRPGLRVMYMSGYSDEHSGGHLVRSRAVVLDKPFTTAQLARAVRETLDAPR